MRIAAARRAARNRAAETCSAALIATVMAVLPFAVWVSNRWAIVSATAGAAGIVLLGIALANRREDR